MMALGAETYNEMSYYKTNTLIFTQRNVNEFLIIVELRQEQNEEMYIELNTFRARHETSLLGEFVFLFRIN